MRRQQSDSAGERDLGPELFGIGGGSERGRTQGHYGESSAHDEPFYEQSNALRRGFGHRGEMPEGRWQSEHAELGTSYPRVSEGGFGAGGSWSEWRDVARDRRGPRGYTRSDERIREFICERLAQHHQLDVSDVSVEVMSGRVILEGTVPDRSMKHRIEDTADSCWGVQEVENNIRVQRRGQESTSEGGSRAGAEDFVVSDLGPGRASEVDPGATGVRPEASTGKNA